MTGVTAGQAALQPVESVYLYHWRFDLGEEFGLYRHREDADAMAATRAGEGLAEVIGIALLDRPEPQPAPGLAEAPFGTVPGDYDEWPDPENPITGRTPGAAGPEVAAMAEAQDLRELLAEVLASISSGEFTAQASRHLNKLSGWYRRAEIEQP